MKKITGFLFITVAVMVFLSCKKEPPCEGCTVNNVTVSPDLSLAIQWQKALGGTRVDVAQSIRPTADGGYIVAGNTNSQDGDISGYQPGPTGCYQTCFNQTICGDYFPDGFVVKLSSSGAVQWQKALGGPGPENLLSIQSTADGGYIASGLLTPTMAM